VHVEVDISNMEKIHTSDTFVDVVVDEEDSVTTRRESILFAQKRFMEAEGDCPKMVIQ